jgi:hypothetical protein
VRQPHMPVCSLVDIGQRGAEASPADSLRKLPRSGTGRAAPRTLAHAIYGWPQSGQRARPVGRRGAGDPSRRAAPCATVRRRDPARGPGGSPGRKRSQLETFRSGSARRPEVRHTVSVLGRIFRERSPGAARGVCAHSVARRPWLRVFALGRQGRTVAGQAAAAACPGSGQACRGSPRSTPGSSCRVVPFSRKSQNQPAYPTRNAYAEVLPLKPSQTAPAYPQLL